MNRPLSTRKTALLIFILYVAAVGISSCSKKPPEPEPQPVNPSDDFSAKVLPILQARCNASGCHGGQTPADSAGGLVFASFERMRQTVGQKNSWAKPLVVPGNPDSSHLVLTIRRLRASFMPPNSADALSQTEIKTISDWIAQGAKGPGGKKFPTYAQGKVYVANSTDGRVDVIDLSTNFKADSISVTVTGEIPSVVQTHHIVAAPDKKFIYVTNAWAVGHVIKIDAAADTVVARVRAGYQPADIVISPDGQQVYLSNYNQNSTQFTTPNSTVRKFNTQAMTLADTFVVGRAPHGVGISKDGKIVLTPGQESDDLWFLYPDSGSGATRQLPLAPGVSPLKLVYRPFGVLLSSNDSLAYVSCTGNHQIRIVDVRSRTVVDSIVLDPLLGDDPYMLALSPDGNTLYVPCNGSQTVAVVNLQTNTVTAYVPVGFKAHGPALAKNGAYLYVTCEGNHSVPYKVYVVNTTTNTAVDSIDVGRFANGIAIIEP